MATISERAMSDGTTAYKASIRLKQGGVLWHNESRTFNKRAYAQTWAKRREHELRELGPAAQPATRTSKLTVGDIVQSYLDLLNGGPRSLTKNRRSCLERLAREFSTTRAQTLTPMDIIDFAKRRATLDGAAPSTVNQDLIYLGVALRDANDVMGLPCAYESVAKSKRMLKRMDLIGNSRKRSRRLQGDEEDQLMAEFARQEDDYRSSIPMHEIFRFAIASCMRQGEITRIRWDDLNEKNRTVIIRERKDPKNKHDRHDVVPLLGEAWDLIQSQPSAGKFIFPYRKDSIRARFSRACDRLAIADLRFHDLRREGATRLLEQGYPATKVILVTGHHDWNQFARYVGLRPEDLHGYGDEGGERRAGADRSRRPSPQCGPSTGPFDCHSS